MFKIVLLSYCTRQFVPIESDGAAAAKALSPSVFFVFVDGGTNIWIIYVPCTVRIMYKKITTSWFWYTLYAAY